MTIYFRVLGSLGAVGALAAKIGIRLAALGVKKPRSEDQGCYLRGLLPVLAAVFDPPACRFQTTA